MGDNEIWKIEEEYNRNTRLLDDAEETLNSYRKQMQQKTENLAEYIYSFYSNLEKNDSYHYIRKLEESAEEFSQGLRQQQQDLEEIREEKQREFKRRQDL